MATRRIEDLPTLPTETQSFDPDADYVIIQKPGGASYKMTASSFLSQAVGIRQYSAASSILINTNANAGNRIRFQFDNLLSANTNFTINIFAGANMSTIVKQSGNLLINEVDGFIPSTSEQLQLTGGGDNTLLHEASYVGNYSAARLLVLKGIDIFACMHIFNG